jgi:hypothetical protein
VGVILCFGVHKLSNNLVNSNYTSYKLVLFFYKGWFVDYVYGFAGRKILNYSFDFFLFDKKTLELMGPLALAQLAYQGATWVQHLSGRPIRSKRLHEPSVYGTANRLRTLVTTSSAGVIATGRPRFTLSPRNLSSRRERTPTSKFTRPNLTTHALQHREYFTYLVCAVCFFIILIFGVGF